MSFRFDHDDDYGDMAEINVTPLVDVMLVLLIIFMVTAPMLTQGLTVALPAEAVTDALEQLPPMLGVVATRMPAGSVSISNLKSWSRSSF